MLLLVLRRRRIEPPLQLYALLIHESIFQGLGSIHGLVVGVRTVDAVVHGQVGEGCEHERHLRKGEDAPAKCSTPMPLSATQSGQPQAASH